MQITVSLDASAVIARLKDVTDNLTEDLRAITFDTMKQGKKKIADVVQTEITALDREIKKTIRHKKVGLTAYKLIVDPGRRMPLSAFRPKPRQTKTGVTYKISKTQGSKSIPHAFLNPHTRTPNEPKIRGSGSGPSGLVGRSPIFFLGLGPSAWGVLVTGNRVHRVISFLEIKLRKNARERLRARIGGHIT